MPCWRSRRRAGRRMPRQRPRANDFESARRRADLGVAVRVAGRRARNLLGGPPLAAAPDDPERLDVPEPSVYRPAPAQLPADAAVLAGYPGSPARSGTWPRVD